jgi:hypothetical protein
VDWSLEKLCLNISELYIITYPSVQSTILCFLLYQHYDSCFLNACHVWLKRCVFDDLFMKEVKVSFPTLTICMHFGMEMLEKQCGISCSQMILYINILLYFHACCIKMSLPMKRHLRYIHVYFICEIRSGSTRLILQHCNSVIAWRTVFRIRIHMDQRIRIWIWTQAGQNYFKKRKKWK